MALVFKVAMLVLIELAARVVQVSNGILKSTPTVGKRLGKGNTSAQSTVEHLREILV